MNQLQIEVYLNVLSDGFVWMHILTVEAHSPIYCLKDNWEDYFKLRQKLEIILLTNILYVQFRQISLHDYDNGML